MTKQESEIGSQTAKAGIHLGFGGIISLIVQGVTLILLARILLPSGFGLYNKVLVVITLLLPIRDMGIPASVQYHAATLSKQSSNNYRIIGVIGYLWELGIGLLFSLFFFLFSPIIAVSINGSDILTVMLASFGILSFSVIFTSVYSLCIGAMKSGRASGLLIIDSTLRGSISLLFAWFGFGPAGAMLGYSIGSCGSALVSLIVLFSLGRQTSTTEVNQMKNKILYESY